LQLCAFCHSLDDYFQMEPSLMSRPCYTVLLLCLLRSYIWIVTVRKSDFIPTASCQSHPQCRQKLEWISSSALDVLWTGK